MIGARLISAGLKYAGLAMYVEMVWENSVLRPVRPLRFKRRIVTVEVADADVEPAAESESEQSAVVRGAAEGIGAELNALMKSYRSRIPAADSWENKAAWHQHLAEKHLDRGQTFGPKRECVERRIVQRTSRQES
ncbi:MAG: hypothetical protein J5I81_03145 [Nitrococcus mobilis]|nr:hypothetical protein [Nitrococcus mobilis]